MPLAAEFLGDGAEKLGVAGGQGFGEEAGIAVGGVHRQVLRGWVCGLSRAGTAARKGKNPT
jgi:hypothetical protein